MNTFSSPVLSGFLPFELFFFMQTTNLTELHIYPIEQCASCHNNYLQLLKEKAKFVEGILLDYKAQDVERRALSASLCQKVETSSEGNLVYLHGPHESSLLIEATNSWQDYIGPIVINTPFDSTRNKFRELENRVLLEMFHINRLKVAFVSTSQIKVKVS